MKVNCIGNCMMSEEEIGAYIERGQEKFGEVLEAMDIECVDDGTAKLTYHLRTNVPFERVRRITGYLVGTMDKWNDAKRAEEKERVKHDV